MSICVIHPKASAKSAARLAAALQCDAFNPYKSDKFNFLNYDMVFNYGVSAPVKAKKIVNVPWAVETCVSKTQTYTTLQQAGIPTVNFVKFKKDVPKTWKHIVCRETENDHSNKGMSIINQGDELPIAYFYAEYYKHKHEFRIVVFRGKVVARYIKQENKDNEWEFVHLDPEGFDTIDKACADAAIALGIEFVGLDVLAKTPTDFRVLEANSGPIMTPEVLKVLVKEFANA